MADVIGKAEVEGMTINMEEAAGIVVTYRAIDGGVPAATLNTVHLLLLR